MYDHQPPPAGAVALTLKYSPLAFMLGLFKPYLAVNGHPVPAGWGRTVVPLQPGQHHLHVHVPYLLPSRIGSADLTVAVYPGQTLELEYRAPMVAFLGGSLGGPPQKYRGMGATIAILVVTLLILLCGCGGLILAAANSDTEPAGLPAPRAARPTLTVPTIDPLPTRTASATPEAAKPTLRTVPARSVVGPTFKAGDKTYLMDFAGWPFAFRTPGTWGCLAGKISLADAKAWVCVDEGNPGSGQRVTVMLRPCPEPCSAAQQSRLSTAWFDEGATARRHDARTTYVEQSRNAKGRYLLDVSHFFAAEPGGPPVWQVGVGGTAPPATRATVQKIVNEVYSQTS